MGKGYNGPSFDDLMDAFGSSLSPASRKGIVLFLWVAGAAVMGAGAYGLAAEYLSIPGHDFFRNLIPVLGEHRGPHWPLGSLILVAVGYALLRAAYILARGQV
jgi:hypothetical protein